MLPPENAEDHESCVSAVEVVASDSIGDGKGGDNRGVPTEVGRVWKLFNVLFRYQVPRANLESHRKLPGRIELPDF